MKKMFLSLATIAFVATGTLTVTSCGSDDSTPNPDPVPDPELTENFVKFEGEQFEVWGAEYSVDVEGDYDYIYTDVEGLPEGYYIYYSTYLYSEDIQGATSLADVEIYGVIGYFVQLQDVELDDDGDIVDYTFVLPHEATTLYYDRAGIVNYGNQLGSSISNLSLNINTFMLGQSSLTTDFDGFVTYNTGNVTFDYNEDAGFFGEDVSGAKSTAISIKSEMTDLLNKDNGASLKDNATVLKVLKK